MRNIILAKTYTGCSDYDYDVTFENARAVPIDEVKSLGLTDDRTLRENASSSEVLLWHEVRVGSRITIHERDGDSGTETWSIFEVQTDLREPPQKVEDLWRKPLMAYLEQHREKIS